MTDSLLSTKLYIPSARPELVSRAELIKQLTSGLHRALTLISAPAGFGKTTLVADWIKAFPLNSSAITQDIPRVAWLSLDEADNDLKRFLTYFIAALKQVAGANAEFGSAALEMLRSPQFPSNETILTSLINEISSIDNKVVVILDDYHLIESQPIHQFLGFWLENVPPLIHTVLITREDPNLPLSRLRARDQLTELRTADLRFSEQEVAQFLNDVMGLGLDAQSVAALKARTEGWIVGLQMAALSMRDHQDVQGFIKGFSGTNRYILDYLLEEVLASQPPGIQDFLLQTSILRRINASLGDAVLAEEAGSFEEAEGLPVGSGLFVNSHTSAVLDYLDRANLFLVPMDSERRWYRYHHLFAELLQARLKQALSREYLASLHARAADWFEDHNLTYEAVYHASLIPDDERVERLIEQNYMEIFQRSDWPNRHWTGELNFETISKRPRLSIHEAMSRSWLGQLDTAEKLLDEAEKRLQAGPSTSETRALLGHSAYVRSRVTAMRGDYQKAIELCMIARENTPHDNQGLLGGIGVMLGYGYFLNGDFEQAIGTLKDTIETGNISGAINTTIGAYCVLARLYTIQGRLRKAYAVYQEAERVILDSDTEHRGAMSIVDMGLAEVLYEWNDLDSALTRIAKGLEFVPVWSKVDDIALAHTIHAKVLHALGRKTEAGETIQIGIEVIQSNGSFAEARDAVLAVEIRLHLNEQDRLKVHRMGGLLEERLGQNNVFRFDNELLLITLARVYIGQNKLHEAIELLSRLETQAQAAGRIGRLIEILINNAVALHSMGELDQGCSTLERALALAEPENYLRVFLDEGQPIRDLLNLWMARSDGSLHQEYARRLLSEFGTQQGTPSENRQQISSAGGLIESLSPREIEVLHQIAQGKTNKEIAQALVVSPGTVKAHTSNIYRKLDVSNRTEAVARARQLEVLTE